MASDRTIGSTLICADVNCTNTFEMRHSRQLFCPECAERRKTKKHNKKVPKPKASQAETDEIKKACPIVISPESLAGGLARDCEPLIRDLAAAVHASVEMRDFGPRTDRLIDCLGDIMEMRRFFICDGGRG